MSSETGIWKIALLGRLKAERDGKIVERFPTRKAAALLALLALEPERPHERARLAERLWGSDTPATTRQNLRKALSLLTIALGPELFEANARTIRLRPGAFVTDLKALEAARRGRRWQEALALDVGELVPELTEDALVPYQNRHRAEREKALAALAGEPGDAPQDTFTPVPHPLRPLVGRRADAEALAFGLTDGSGRLVTVTGPGGMGKTRLAVEAARQVEGAFARVVWCPLADWGTPDATLAAAARALGVRVSDGDMLAALAGALAEPTLLVLDNAEHLLPGLAAPLETLLEQAGRLTCLVTSRLPLGLVGEREFPLPPLAPEDAMALLRQRVEGVRPRQVWDAAESEAAREVCARLDGIPLAIELAANRTRTRDVVALARALAAEGIGGLRADEAGRPERHRTLRRAIEGSLAPLLPATSHRFEALGVFAGSFSTEAAAALWDVAREEASDSLDALVRHGVTLSLTALPFEAEGRFRLLEPLREVALSRLAEALEVERETRRRHADFFLEIGGRIESLRRVGRDETPYLWLEAETPNLHAALDFALADTPARATAAIQTSRTLAWAWRVRGFGAALDACRHHERFAAREAELPQEDRWLVWLVRGELALRAGDLFGAEPPLRTAIDLLEGRAEFVSVEPWQRLGEVLLESDRRDEGIAQIETATRRALDAGERERAAWTLAILGGWLREREDWERWHPVATRARALENEVRGFSADAPHEVWDWDIARLEAHEGRWSEAERLLKSVTESYRAKGWKGWEAGALYELAFFIECQGREREAAPLYAASVALFETLGAHGGLAEARRRVAGYRRSA